MKTKTKKAFKKLAADLLLVAVYGGIPMLLVTRIASRT